MTTNAIKNLPITLKNVETADKVFGPDVGSLKGMVTRNLPMLVFNMRTSKNKRTKQKDTAGST